MYRRQRIYFDQKSAVYRVDHNGLLENKHRSIFIVVYSSFKVDSNVSQS